MTLPDGTEWSADSKLIFEELNRIDPKRWRDSQPPFVQNYKATPLMVGGTLYVNTPSSVGAAFDARTGALKWIYNPKSYEVRHDDDEPCGGISAASRTGARATTSASTGAPATATSLR